MDPATFPEHETFIQHRIESGQNRDASDVIREALDLLKSEEQGREALRAAIAHGDEQIRQGRLTRRSPDLLKRILREEQDRLSSERIPGATPS